MSNTQAMSHLSAASIVGWGAVSPTGWSAASLYERTLSGVPVETKAAKRDGGAPAVTISEVPLMPQMPAWMKFPRLRRTTTVAKYALHAAIEALGMERFEAVQKGELKIGVIFCTMNGCVQFSRRFFAEVLSDPSLASPIFFPETVYNAPSSHLSALLSSTEANYTLVGDSSQFIAGIDLAMQWIEDGLMEGCLVVSAEERDWLSDEALHLFGRSAVAAEGAAAVYLSPTPTAEAVRVTKMSQAWTYGNTLTPREATTKMKDELKDEAADLLCDGLGKAAPAIENAEESVWQGWQAKRLSVRKIVGEGFGISSGWQTVLACEAIRSGDHQSVIVASTGLSQQAAGMVLSKG